MYRPERRTHTHTPCRLNHGEFGHPTLSKPFVLSIHLVTINVRAIVSLKVGVSQAASQEVRLFRKILAKCQKPLSPLVDGRAHSLFVEDKKVLVFYLEIISTRCHRTKAPGVRSLCAAI